MEEIAVVCKDYMSGSITMIAAHYCIATLFRTTRPFVMEDVGEIMDDTLKTWADLVKQDEEVLVPIGVDIEAW